MVKKYVRCPVCSEMAPVDSGPELVAGHHRFPVTVRVEHNDHHFYVNLDSRGSVSDVLGPELVE